MKTEIKSDLVKICSAVLIFGFSVGLGAKASARTDAIYSVPMANSSLAQAAEFPTRSDQNVYGAPDTTGKLRFALPEELTGLQTDFEIIRQANGLWAGAGTDGSRINGDCAREDKKWFSCKVDFSGLKIDQPSRDQILGARFGRGFDFDQRLQVARIFEGQPIGVIKLRIDRNAKCEYKP